MILLETKNPEISFFLRVVRDLSLESLSSGSKSYNETIDVIAIAFVKIISKEVVCIALILKVVVIDVEQVGGWIGNSVMVNPELFLLK